MTIGELFRRDSPDWRHECCYPLNCFYRFAVRGVKKCGAPACCGYYVPKAKAKQKKKGRKA